MDLVLRIELLFELGDFTFLGGGEVLGVVATHLCLCVCVCESSSSLSERARERERVEEDEEEERLWQMPMVVTQKIENGL